VFTSIYGTGINLAPTGFGTANLSNSGETITLRDASGSLIRSFTYFDASPWPTTPDGGGPSLEIIDPEGDPNDPSNWRASNFHGGSPGSSGALAIAGDYDGNGIVEQQDYVVWKANFGKQVPAGSGADGNADGFVSAADFVFWRMHHAAQSAAAATIVAFSSPAIAEQMTTPAAPIAAVGREESDSQYDVLATLATESVTGLETDPIDPSATMYRRPAGSVVAIEGTDLLLVSGVLDATANEESPVDASRQRAPAEIDQVLDGFDGHAYWADEELLSVLGEELRAAFGG
jgi:hypothetical protein